MIEKALRYINGLKAPAIREIDGETYSDKPLHRVKHNPKAEPLKLSTLTSLVDYIVSGIDRRLCTHLFVHVQSPTRVVLFSQLDDDREREKLAEVNAILPSFDFDCFMDHERFCIALQSKFIDNADRALLLKFAGTVEAGSVAEYGDDGISQKATIKTGIASKDEALVPSPACLSPYRTFLEVDQPFSEFVFRMRQERNGEIGCALFEADGGAWRANAMYAVREFLVNALKDVEDLIVIS